MLKIRRKKTRKSSKEERKLLDGYTKTTENKDKRERERERKRISSQFLVAIKVKTAAEATATAEEQNRTELSTRQLNVEGRKEKEEKKDKKTARKPEIDAISSAQLSPAQLYTLPILFFAASNLITTSTDWLLTACTAAADLLESK